MRSSGVWQLTGVIVLVTVLEVILTGTGNRVRNYSENLVRRKKTFSRLMYVEHLKSVSSACNALMFFFFFSIILRSEALVKKKYISFRLTLSRFMEIMRRFSYKHCISDAFSYPSRWLPNP